MARTKAPKAAEPEARPTAPFAYVAAAAFLACAALMVMELVASRILAPVYGNTVYLWTSVIGLIMLAMTLGYAWGGRLADRDAGLGGLAWCLLAAGLLVGTIPFAAGPVLALVPPEREVLGLTVATSLLFLAPALAMACVSPLAVKLVAGEGTTVGKASGAVSALGSLGSILGTFLAGFVLIPHLGSRVILGGTALLLVATAGVGFALAARVGPVRGPALFAVLVGGALGLAGGLAPEADAAYLYDHQTFYHRVRVSERGWGGRPLRALTLDTTMEGAMYLDGDDLPLEYTRYVEAVALFVERPARALFVGGGAFSMPKRFVAAFPGARARVLELDPVVIEVGRRWFGLDRFPAIEVAAGDARAALGRDPGSYDLVFGDAYNGIRQVPPHLSTLEYYTKVRERIAPGGVYMTNIIAALRGPASPFFAATARTLREVFPSLHVFATRGPPDEAQNLILVAPLAPGPVPYSTLVERGRARGIAELAQSWVPPAVWEATVAAGTLLTDDYCPAEYLVRAGGLSG